MATMSNTRMMPSMDNYTTTTMAEENLGIGVNDATWVLISTFIIFTMQSGECTMAVGECTMAVG